MAVHVHTFEHFCKRIIKQYFVLKLFEQEKFLIFISLRKLTYFQKVVDVCSSR